MELKPLIISWNITGRCNLLCAHCYLEASAAGSPEELDTSEALSLLGQMARLAPGAMLVFSGGEPLLREDVVALVSEASRSGLMPVLGTNGSRLNGAMLAALKRAGLKGIGFSLDSPRPQQHDVFRGSPGNYQATVKSMELCRSMGVEFQVHSVINKSNRNELSALMELSHGLGARALNLFFLVHTGKGKFLPDLSPQQYEDVLTEIVQTGGSHKGLMVRARCAPHIKRIAQLKGDKPDSFAYHLSSCIAGTHYFRITSTGDVTPCPYLPLSAGNIREGSLEEIWSDSPLFKTLRSPALGGKCGSCRFSSLCRGCRARTYAATGDPSGEDTLCLCPPYIAPHAGGIEGRVTWEPEAEERLRRVPSLVREMVKRAVEGYARSLGLKSVSPKLMMEVKALRKKEDSIQ